MPLLWKSPQPLSVKRLRQIKNIRPLLPIEVWEYIDEMNFYK